MPPKEQSTTMRSFYSVEDSLVSNDFPRIVSSLGNISGDEVTFSPSLKGYVSMKKDMLSRMRIALSPQEAIDLHVKESEEDVSSLTKRLEYAKRRLSRALDLREGMEMQLKKIDGEEVTYSIKVVLNVRKEKRLEWLRGIHETSIVLRVDAASPVDAYRRVAWTMKRVDLDTFYWKHTDEWYNPSGELIDKKIIEEAVSTAEFMENTNEKIQ